ncbi:uncharacterized protein LOC122037025 [Zingiber officinale]|uniref:uncharacterized protein LOC122037025 n=1 Tax=Zingiber officinale TaxID=94328 RepID=UPI001C4BB68F|nr:uncharacterized protein LOC122037025 [Zingiber officinale]
MTTAMEEALPTSPKTTDGVSKDDSLSSHISSRSRSRSRRFPSSASPAPPSSAVPFSWEQRPGIPKDTSSPESSVANPVLPLPPPIRSHSDLPTPRKKRSAAASSSRGAEVPADPFAAALALCAKGLMDDDDLPVPRGSALMDEDDLSVPRRSTATVSGRFRIFDFYGSCKATCAVATCFPRPGSLALLSRRP